MVSLHWDPRHKVPSDWTTASRKLEIALGGAPGHKIKDPTATNTCFINLFCATGALITKMN